MADNNKEKLPAAVIPEVIDDPIVESSEQAVLRESRDERIDLDLDRKETPEQLIDGIDLQVPPEQQKENLDALESALYGYLVGLLDAKRLDVERAKRDLPYFFGINGSANVTEAASLRALNKINSSPDSKVYPWLIEYPKLIDEAVKFHEASLQQRKDIEAQKPSGWNDLNGKVNTGILIAAGAIGGAMVLNWAWKRHKKAKATSEAEVVDAEKPLVSPGLLKTASMTLTAVTLGYKVISSEKVGAWVREYFGFSLEPDVLKQFVVLIFSGKWGEALDTLFGRLEVKDPLILESAAAMRVDAKNLMIVSEHDYTKFMTAGSQINREIEGMAQRLLPDLNLPFSMTAKEKLALVEDEKKVYDYLHSKRDILNTLDPAPESIRDALAALKESEALDAADAAGAPDETPKDPEQLEVSHIPHINASIDRWKANGENITELPDLAQDILVAAKDDAATVVASEGGVFIFKAGGWLAISTLSILGQTFITAMEAAVSEDVTAGDALETYYDSGGKYFIWTGASVATSGVIHAIKTQKLKYAVSGAKLGGRIAAGPFELMNLSAKASQRMYRNGVDWYYRGQQIETPNDYIKAEWLHKRAQFHAEIYKKYYDIKHGTSLAAKAQKRLMGNRLDILMERHGNLFSDAYRELHGTTKVGEPVRPWRFDNSDIQDELRTRATEITEGSLKQFEFFEEPVIRARAEQIATQRGGNVESYMQEARQQLHTEAQQPTPKTGITTHAEATARGLVEIAPDQITRLKQLGVTEQAILRMREMGAQSSEIARVIDELTPPGTRLRRLRNLEYLMRTVQWESSAWSQVYKNGVKTLGILGIAAMAYGLNKSEDKFEFMVHAASGLVAFGATLAVTERATVRIPHRGLQQGVALIAAIGISVGLDMGFWDDTGGYWLEKYSPDRKHDYASHTTGGQVLEGAAWGTSMFGLIDMAEWAGEGMGLGKGVDATTDPIDYLEDTVSTLKPFADDGWDKSIFKQWKVHSVDDLKLNAAETLVEKKEELVALMEVDPKNTEEIKRLKSEVRTLESYANGSWVNELRILMQVREMRYLSPAQDEFKRLAAARFPEEGAAIFDGFMQRLRANQPLIQNEKDTQVWEYLMSESVDLNEEAMEFRTFAGNLRYQAERMNFLDKNFPIQEGEEGGDFDLEAFEESIAYLEEDENNETKEGEPAPTSSEEEGGGEAQAA